jgi:hypothetical protein
VVDGKTTTDFNAAGHITIAATQYALTLNGSALTPGSNRFDTSVAGHGADFTMYVPHQPFVALDQFTGYIQLATDHKSGSFSFQYKFDGGSSPKPGSFRGAFTCS